MRFYFNIQARSSSTIFFLNYSKCDIKNKRISNKKSSTLHPSVNIFTICSARFFFQFTTFAASGVSARRISQSKSRTIFPKCNTWLHVCTYVYACATSIMRSNAKNVKDKGRTERSGGEDRQRGKKFDKKRYRLQKYSNKYKGTYTVYATNRLTFIQRFLFALVNQWEERRKKAVLREFYKELKKDQPNSAELSLSSSGASKSVDERWVRINSRSGAPNLILMKCMCEQQINEEGLRLFQG